MSNSATGYAESLKQLVEESTEIGFQRAMGEFLERQEERLARLEEAMIATKAVLTEPEAARYAGRSRRQLRRWREEGLPFTRRGTSVYYRREDLEAWLLQSDSDEVAASGESD